MHMHALSRGEQLTGFLRRELKPRGKLITPFNVVSGAIILAAAAILAVRFLNGLGSVTHLSQEFPWGLWKGFNVVAGVALAGGAYVLTFLVYILRLEVYRPIVRVTVLNGFLAYVFYAGALLLDLGRPWNVMNPIIGNSFGLSSVLFLVAWHFLLYMSATLVEFSPAVAEWLGWRRIHRWLSGLTLGAVILGITLSTLHQSGLGALFLMARTKIHPLWYSELIPVLFFVSSIYAGLSMVILEGSISHRVFYDRLSPELIRSGDEIVRRLSRICCGVLFVYFFLEVLKFIHGQMWRFLQGGYALWYLFEIFGLVVGPMFLFAWGSLSQRPKVIRIAALVTIAGVIINRLNVSVIAFKWYEPVHYWPSWMEIVVALAIISVEIWVFRWIIYRMPVLNNPPSWARKGHEDAPPSAYGVRA